MTTSKLPPPLVFDTTVLSNLAVSDDLQLLDAVDEHGREQCIELFREAFKERLDEDHGLIPTARIILSQSSIATQFVPEEINSETARWVLV